MSDTTVIATQMCEERDVENTRLDWIDSLKAIAIFLVLIGHTTANVRIEAYIYSFHLPLFFLISGFLFRIEKYPSFRKFLFRRFSTLIIPYFTFAILSYVVWLVLVRSLSVRGQVNSVNPWFPFWGIFYGIGDGLWRHPLDLALWFLPCLFVTEVIYWIIKRYFHRKLFLGVILICGFAGYFTSIWASFRFPWSCDVALTAGVFYGLGDMLKGAVQRTFAIRFRVRILLLMLLFVVGFGISLLNGKADMNYNVYGNPMLFYSGAIFGSMFWIITVSLFRPHRIITYIGRNTIVVLGSTGCLSFALQGIYYLATHNLIEANKFHLVGSILYSLLLISCLIPLMHVVTRFVPFMLGRRMEPQGELFKSARRRSSVISSGF